MYRGDGNHLGRVPGFEGTISSTYRCALAKDWKGYIRGDVLYTGSAWDRDLNVFKTKGYAHVNARIGLQHENLTLELFSTNLFNDKTYQYAAITVELSGNFTQRAVLDQAADKREFGLRAQFKF